MAKIPPGKKPNSSFSARSFPSAKPATLPAKAAGNSPKPTEKSGSFAKSAESAAKPTPASFPPAKTLEKNVASSAKSTAPLRKAPTPLPAKAPAKSEPVSAPTSKSAKPTAPAAAPAKAPLKDDFFATPVLKSPKPVAPAPITTAKAPATPSLPPLTIGKPGKPASNTSAKPPTQSLPPLSIGKPAKAVTPAPAAKAPAKAELPPAPIANAKSTKAPAPVTPAPAKVSVKAELPPKTAAKVGKAPATAPAVKVDLISKPPAKSAPPEASRAKAKPSAPPTSAPTRSSKRLLFVTSECTPLAQTGGLGDSVAGLTKALHLRGHEVRIVMPLYGFIDRAKYGITYTRSCCVHFGQGEELWVGIFEGKLDGLVPVWFIDYSRFFERGSIYGDADDAYRYGLLSKAALQVCKDTGFIPHIAHVHDWMSAMSAVFLKTWDRVLSPLSQTASVLTIHNIGYQGKFHPSVLNFYGLGGDYMTPDRLEDYGMVNLLKAGIQYADAVTAVSPTYAREIREPIGGMGMALYLNNRADHLFGILNGVDTTVWNPETDKLLPERYNRKKLAGKAACKRALQERFGLKVDPKIPIFGIVSRFAPQKGFDLLRGALPQALRDMAFQVVALGTGDPVTENFFRWLNGAFPGQANAHIGFAPEIAHLIEAGSDFFLMPSIYEPCGLNQMYSSLYGTLPVVRATGGLEDTVENYNEAAGRGTGFKFWEISDRALYYTIGWAVSTWYDRPQHYRAMQQQGMAHDFTWNASAQQYENVYEHALAHRASL
jgi:starch synthase